MALVKTVPFTKVASFINGMPYNSEFFNTEDGVHVAKIGDVTNKRDESEWEFISEEEFYLQKGQLLTDGDILMTLTGDPPDIGKVSYIHNPINASWNQRVAKIRLAEDQEYFISSNVLYVILSTELIRKQLERYAKGIRQRNLGNESLGRLLVPILSNTIQRKIKDCFVSANDLRLKAKAAYDDASNYLNLILGLNHLVLTEQSTTQKRFKDIKVSDRFDAEYYQPKYEQIVQHIVKYPQGCDTIGNLFFIRDRNYIPVPDRTYQYIELSNVGSDGSITGHTEALGDNLPSRARRIVNSGDIIVSSLEGSLQSCALISDEYNNAICSTGFYVLSPKNINAETALVLFKSLPIQSLMARACSGSIMAAMSTLEFANIKLPKIDDHAQTQIKKIIHESIALKKESVRLLNLAKSAVEVAIEQGEDKALYMLENYTN